MDYKYKRFQYHDEVDTFFKYLEEHGIDSKQNVISVIGIPENYTVFYRTGTKNNKQL